MREAITKKETEMIVFMGLELDYKVNKYNTETKFSYLGKHLKKRGGNHHLFFLLLN
jgi:hypothetical protein